MDPRPPKKEESCPWRAAQIQNVSTVNLLAAVNFHFPAHLYLTLNYVPQSMLAFMRVWQSESVYLLQEYTSKTPEHIFFLPADQKRLRLNGGATRRQPMLFRCKEGKEKYGPKLDSKAAPRQGEEVQSERYSLLFVQRFLSLGQREPRLPSRISNIITAAVKKAPQVSVDGDGRKRRLSRGGGDLTFIRA